MSEHIEAPIHEPTVLTEGARSNAKDDFVRHLCLTTHMLFFRIHFRIFELLCSWPSLIFLKRKQRAALKGVVKDWKELCQHMRLNRMIFSHGQFYPGVSQNPVNIERLVAAMTPDSGHFFPVVPKWTVDKELPNVLLPGFLLEDLFDILFQAVGFRNENGAPEIIVSESQETEKTVACDLVIECKGARVPSGVDQERLRKLVREISADNWREWETVGSRMCAAIAFVHHVGGTITIRETQCGVVNFTVRIHVIKAPTH